MQKVKIVIMGKDALVDADQVGKHSRKAELMKRAMKLQAQAVDKPDHAELHDIMGKIVRLNKTIRKNVQFL